MGLGFRVWGNRGCRNQGPGLKVRVAGFRVKVVGIRLEVLGSRV